MSQDWILWGTGLTLIMGLLALLVGWIWRQWLKASPPGELPEYVYPAVPQGRWAQMPFGRIHYLEAGTGPNLVLIHGLGASVFCWRLLIPLLAKKFRVIALDLSGFGLSDKRLDLEYGLDAQTARVEEFLASIKVDKFDVVGSSMGGTHQPMAGFKGPGESEARGGTLSRAASQGVSV